jgi:hypothetical protein
MRSARRLSGLVLALALAASAGRADAGELELINTSLKAIQHLYVARSGTGQWGRDLLLGKRMGSIAPGEQRTIVDLAPATYDLRIVDEDGDDYEIEGIEVETNIKVQLTETQIVDATR